MALLKIKTTKNKRVIYIVTGVSRGIGKAIAENYLNQGFKVIGVGRLHSIEHANFSFEKCDLSDLESTRQLFVNQKFKEPVTLINNAGIIGSIRRISEQEKLDIFYKKLCLVYLFKPWIWLRQVSKIQKAVTGTWNIRIAWTLYLY